MLRNIKRDVLVELRQLKINKKENKICPRALNIALAVPESTCDKHDMKSMIGNLKKNMARIIKIHGATNMACKNSDLFECHGSYCKKKKNFGMMS